MLKENVENITMKQTYTDEKSTMSQVKTTLDGIHSKSDTTEENMRELEDRAIETT